MHASVISSYAAALLGKTWESTGSVLSSGSEWLVSLHSLESFGGQRWWLWDSPERALLIFGRAAGHLCRDGAAVFPPPLMHSRCET